MINDEVYQKWKNAIKVVQDFEKTFIIVKEYKRSRKI